MEKRATIYDIAREAGVSTATVTRVLAGHPSVKTATREKVQRVIDAHAYTPSASARDLERGQTKTIAIVMPPVINPYFTRIYSTAYEEAAANGYSAILYQIKERVPIPSSVIDEIIKRRLDGVLFAGGIWSDNRMGLTEALARLRHHMPAVTICPPTAHPNCICIHSDLIGCSRLPVRHLHALGHRRIAFIGGSMQSRDTSMRADGFLEELRALDLPDDPAYHVDTGFDCEGGERAVLRMLSGLEQKRWPTAIIAFNDLMALGAMKQLKQMGLRLPDDMAIIGCDNQFFCPYTDPPLTTVDLHPEEMTRSAVRELIMAGSGGSSAFTLMLEASLIVRESCGAKLGYRKLK